MADFLHKKKNSSIWYYRRRYPQEVARILSKHVFMVSLKTSVKRDAEKLARKQSVAFDEYCEKTLREYAEANQAIKVAPEDEVTKPKMSLTQLTAIAYERVIEMQNEDKFGWESKVTAYKDFYENMKRGCVPEVAQRPAIEAQAILNGMNLALEGKELPQAVIAPVVPNQVQSNESWSSLRDRALTRYRDKVSISRYQVAERALNGLGVVSTADADVHDALRAWAKRRLENVSPRTVKNEMTSMASALRSVRPSLDVPVLKELKGVLQPKSSDRQPMPLTDLRAVLKAFKSQKKSLKTRKGYNGGASQFDSFAVEVLAVLGIRPRELLSANSDALCTKTQTMGGTGQYLRISDAKNSASIRDIPLSDGQRHVVDLVKLEEMLKWQQANPRSSHGAVTSLGTRFKNISNGYTLYQMRHSWKDLALSKGVDFELRERLLGHKIVGSEVFMAQDRSL